MFPAFKKNCAAASDCFVAMHQIECCGSINALGYNTGEQAAFAAAEQACDHMYPGCGCAPRPTTAEDGQNIGAGNRRIVVDCVAGACKTKVQ